jgi:hypothetical protein
MVRLTLGEAPRIQLTPCQAWTNSIKITTTKVDPVWGLTVLNLVSQVRDVVLMNVYLDLGTPGVRNFGTRGI